jgi:RNA polymerase sigma-70 factor, ECF subfamily
MSARTMLATLAPATASRRIGRNAPASQTHGQRLTTTGIAEADDETLVALIAAGDQRAFAAIVRRYGGRLRAVALRFTGGVGEADDIVQDTFVRFWRTAKRWQPGGPPLGAYLTRIAVNRAIDGDRKRRVRRFFGLEDADEIADPDPPTDDRMAGRSDLGAVVADVKQLPARQRAAILLAAVAVECPFEFFDAHRPCSVRCSRSASRARCVRRALTRSCSTAPSDKSMMPAISAFDRSPAAASRIAAR